MADLIEVRRRILTQTPHLETASGNIAVLSGSIKAPLKSLRVDLEPMQSGSGDPSPTNVRPITGSTGVTVQVLDKSGNSTTIPVSWENQAGTVYGGYVDLISGELVVNRGFVTLDGNTIKFSGMYTDATRYRAYTPARSISGLMYGSGKDAKPIASNMLGKPNVESGNLDYIPPFITAGGYSAQFYVALPLSLGFSTVADANTWLSANPIQVSYLLANEQRYQLSPQQIKAFRGNNYIFANDKKITTKYWTVKAANKTIGGLPVIFDNARYPSRNGLITGYETDDRYFITGIYDTGSPDAKSITYSRSPASKINTSMRLFNNISAQSYDYWSATGSTERTLTSGGRYILTSILKTDAANMYMYISKDGQRVYLYKGLNVT